MKRHRHVPHLNLIAPGSGRPADQRRLVPPRTAVMVDRETGPQAELLAEHKEATPIAFGDWTVVIGLAIAYCNLDTHCERSGFGRVLRRDPRRAGNEKSFLSARIRTCTS